MITNTKMPNLVFIPHPDLVNIYGAEIGENTFIGPFVEIQKGVKIGNNCKIESHTFICEGVTIGDNVFIGHGVIFTNDLIPRIGKNWKGPIKTIVENEVSIGSNATILPVILHYGCLIGAGAVVTKNIEANKTVKGNPAK